LRHLYPNRQSFDEGILLNLAISFLDDHSSAMAEPRKETTGDISDGENGASRNHTIEADTDTETRNPVSANTYEDKNELDDQDDEDDEEDDEVFDKNNVGLHIEILRLREKLVNAKENEIRAYKAQLPYTEHLTVWCRYRAAQSNPAYVKYANDFHFSMPSHMPTLKALRFAVELAGMERSMVGLNLEVAEAALRRIKKFGIILLL
jgi:hypothetical protein